MPEINPKYIVYKALLYYCWWMCSKSCSISIGEEEEVELENP
jgi:hypothetical protein